MRLILRNWLDTDLQPFAEMNSDRRVCEFLPTTLTHNESEEFARRIQTHFEQHGFGLWAVEAKGGEPFIGFTGLSAPSFDAHFTPCVEIGWRLAFDHWEKGYATEAAMAVKNYAFGNLALKDIVSFTAFGNLRSRALMERIGMTHNPQDDFDHPLLPKAHRLSRHVLYRCWV